MKLINLLPFVLLILLFTSCSQEEDGPTVFASSSQYQCVSRQLTNSCIAGFSSTLKTCYYFDENGDQRGLRCTEGWIEYTFESVTDDYFCYTGKDYCRLNGKLSNPKVFRSDI